MRRWRLSAAAAVLTGACLVTGCATPRAALGPAQSACFHALPAASAAVGKQGRFAGLALTDVPAQFGAPRLNRRQPVTPSTLAPRPPAPGETTTTLPRRDVCLVAFRGPFDIAKIPLLRGPNRTGRYATVVVGVRSHRALFVYLTDGLPRGFRHL